MNNKKYNEYNTLDSLMQDFLNKGNEENIKFDQNEDPFSRAVVNDNKQLEIDLNWWREENEIKNPNLKITNIDGIINFLRIVHPFLNEEGYSPFCMEIRPVRRAGKSFILSKNLWRLDEKGILELKKWLSKFNNEMFCIYYSIYTSEYKETLKANGKHYKKGYTNNLNAVYTQILAADFDNIDKEEHDKYIKIFNKLGIETVTVFTGHGYQDLILLNEKIYDKTILEKFTVLLRQKGFNIDSKIIDPARVMRLPYTYNFKEFDIHSPYYNSKNPIAVPTELVRVTDNRYSVEYILNLISTLEDNPLDDIKGNTKDKNKTIKNTDIPSKSKDTLKAEDKKKKEIKLKIKKTDINFLSIKQEYNMINFDRLPDSVKLMLIETPQGLRNDVLLYLALYLKNSLGLSMDVAKEVISIWGKHCVPELDSNFSRAELVRLWTDYDHKGKYGKVTEDMIKVFGIPKLEAYNRDTKIIINNSFFEKYAELSDGAVRIYLAILLEEKIEKKKKWIKDEIIDIAGISESTFKRNITDLIEHNFLDKKRANKKIGGVYTYYINKFKSSTKGFTQFDTSFIDNMLNNKRRALNDAEIKLYTYLAYVVGFDNTICWLSQSTIAKAISKDRTTITRLTKSLHEKKYLKKSTTLDVKGIPHCKYTLNF